MLKPINIFFAYIYRNYWSINIIKKYKEKLQKEAHERYQNLSEEEKEKRKNKPGIDHRQYQRDRNENFYKEKKQKKVEYMKNYYLAC